MKLLAMEAKLTARNKPSRFALYLWIVCGVFALTSLLFVGVGFVPQWLLGFESEAGTFGDSFGFVNSLFSAFAFAGLLITLLIQINEFHLAQEERRESIEVQKQISDQHAMDLEVQKQISDQQYLASIVSTISTWQQMNPVVPRPLLRKLAVRHILYAKQRYLNNVLLAMTQRHMLDGLTPAEASSLLDRIKKDSTISIEYQLAELYGQIGLLVINAYRAAQDTMDEDSFEKDYGTLLQDFAKKVVEGYANVHKLYSDETKDKNVRAGAHHFFAEIGGYFYGMKVTAELKQELSYESFEKILHAFRVNVLGPTCSALHYE